MRAVTIVEGDLLWTEHPEPTDTELLVAVRAAGLNAADLLQRRGFYPAPAGVPADIPGMELAGVVEAVGGRVSRFAPGDRVMALVGGGAQAELALVDETAALAVPDGLPWADAGGFVEVFATAHDALFRQCDLTLGDRVLVTGAAGGVGTAAVQLAAVAGARVVASVRRPELRPALLDLGAAEALDPDEAAAAGPFDVALELVGAASLPAVLPALAIGGRVAVIGVGGGARVELDLLTLMGRRARISGATLRARTLLEKALVIGALETAVVPLLAAGRLRVTLSATFRFDQAPAAYDHFAAGGKLGKVVLLADG